MARPAPEPSDEASASEGNGPFFVIGFVGLILVFMVAVFATVAWNLNAEDRAVLAFPFVRLGFSALVALGLFVAWDAWRLERSGWWWYVLAAGVPLVNIGVVVWWLARGRREERALGRWTV